MRLVSLNPQDPVPLIDQIVSAISTRVEERALRPGTRLPSVRGFAAEHGVSRFTVVQAYDRLVAMGYLTSRPGSGFYVAARRSPRTSNGDECRLDRAMDVLWLLRNALREQATDPMPGAGWLPGSWMDETGIQRSLRNLSHRGGDFLTGYGLPAGYGPLRQLLQHHLGEIGVVADETQIVLTRGVSHAADLVMRYLVRAGDAVLVDDPGYFILFGSLKSLGAKLVGVPWNTDGPDIGVLESLIREHRPKVFFTNTVLHNPTGASISQPVAYRILQLAEKYGLTIVEDDIYGDFHPAAVTRLASLDQLDRVIYLNSFSKSVSAGLRVGYIACKRELAESLTDLKLLTGLTTSVINERLVYQLLTEGHYRKHLDKMRRRLHGAREKMVRGLEKAGLMPGLEPEGGMFVWARLGGEHSDAAEVASRAARQGITLAPGTLFRPYQEPSPWLRFNAASCDDGRLFEFLAGLA
jgi:DNA-binding transcriptional MocR family regulator